MAEKLAGAATSPKVLNEMRYSQLQDVDDLLGRLPKGSGRCGGLESCGAVGSCEVASRLPPSPIGADHTLSLLGF